MKLQALPRTAAHKFHQSTPAEAPATRPSCFDRRWPETQMLEFIYTYTCAHTGETKGKCDSAYHKATSQAYSP